MHTSFLDMLWNTLKLTQVKTQMDYPDNEENLCDFLITFFEELDVYKLQLQNEIDKFKCSAEWVSLIIILPPLTSKIFQAYIKTHIDKITYTILFISLFNTWKEDNTLDTSKTLDEINILCKNIYQKA